MTVLVRGLDVELGGRRVLRSVSMEVEGGSWTAVIGPNGAGKSTLLRAVLGLRDGQGMIAVSGRDVRSMRPRQRARLVAYAPQSPRLPAGMTVFDYALLGRSPYIPHFGRETAHDRSVTAEVLERLDLADLAARTLDQLSGGERQRVVLARALAQQTPVLLLDEPTTALDIGHQQQVMELVDRLRLADGLTVVSTIHDLTLAAQYADRLELLSDGRVAASGPPADVLTRDTIAAHFDANVSVSHDAEGRPLLALERPVRPGEGAAQ
ncbi:ABC transporter ATP-binding protein [Actinomadura rupiterrae]|uniref:ABC transporter ATP-binding protein n=1 Tax=Actinomadura rupiterrae TaxID=559627 RepID=UPI0020A4AC71|nr:ABC transporter ATP-binding protein [Actinomadura rupiterrae]MCP2339505.1 iron complex transport system ATP-binding protein [Actinomadura rupiterrae]